MGHGSEHDDRQVRIDIFITECALQPVLEVLGSGNPILCIATDADQIGVCVCVCVSLSLSLSLPLSLSLYGSKIVSRSRGLLI